jgi:hypothetical protein
MELFEIKTEVPAMAADAVDTTLLELGIDGWSLLEDAIAKRAWIVGIFASEAEAVARGLPPPDTYDGCPVAAYDFLTIAGLAGSVLPPRGQPLEVPPERYAACREHLARVAGHREDALHCLNALRQALAVAADMLEA